MADNLERGLIPLSSHEVIAPQTVVNRVLDEMVESTLVLARAALPVQADLDALVREGDRLRWLRLRVFRSEEATSENNEMPEGREIFQLYHQAGTAGHPKGQFGVSICYRDGEGVQKDEQAELQWLRKSADSGYWLAQIVLGNRCMEGLGVPRSRCEAVMWYRKAADQGSTEAKLKLSRCYDQGLGVAQDSVEAFKLLRQVAERRGGEIKRELAIRYRTGDGVAVNLPQAYEWFRLAAHAVAKGLTPKGWKDAPENTREFIIASVFESDDKRIEARVAAIEAEAAAVAAAMSPSELQVAQRLDCEIKEKYSAER